jgi:uncharacterized spore protein YtfJ
MEHLKDMVGRLGEELRRLAERNAVVAAPISVGDRHAVPLCELSVGCAAGGGKGEGRSPDSKHGSGTGACVATAGGSKANPVAVLIIDRGAARLERVGK